MDEKYERNKKSVSRRCFVISLLIAPIIAKSLGSLFMKDDDGQDNMMLLFILSAYWQ